MRGQKRAKMSTVEGRLTTIRLQRQKESAIIRLAETKRRVVELTKVIDSGACVVIRMQCSRWHTGREEGIECQL